MQATATDMPPAPEQSAEGAGKGWVNPYKSLFINQEAGFEMGEDYRFKQRVFTFRDKPTEEVRAMLKEAGFTYRPAEKSWTIPATFANRVTADRIAQSIAAGTDKNIQ